MPKSHVLLAGSSCNHLAGVLSGATGVERMEVKITRFADQEIRVQLAASLFGKTAVIMQSTCNPANDLLMELLLLVDAAKRAGATRVIAILPYFGYGRQDRPSYEWGPISARLVVTLLEAAGVDHLITLDLHSQQLEGFFKIGVQNMDPVPLFLPALRENEAPVVVSPDFGGVTRARRLAHSLGASLAIIQKMRDQQNASYVETMIGSVEGKNCIIVDDVVDTAGTLCGAVDFLKEYGAASVRAVITHPVLSKNALMRIESSPLEKLWVMDTIPQSPMPAFLKTISCVPLLAAALMRCIEKK